MTPELEGDNHKVTTQFHVWDHSYITFLAVIVDRQVVENCSTMKRPAKCRVFSLIFLWFGLAPGWPWAPCLMCLIGWASGEWPGATPDPVQSPYLIKVCVNQMINLIGPWYHLAWLFCSYNMRVTMFFTLLETAKVHFGKEEADKETLHTITMC